MMVGFFRINFQIHNYMFFIVLYLKIITESTMLIATIDMERFAGLNIHDFSPMKFFAEVFSQCIGLQCLLLTYS